MHVMSGVNINSAASPMINNSSKSGRSSSSSALLEKQPSQLISSIDDDDPLKDFEPLTDALVYANVEHGWEVMLKQDVSRVRGLLKESFIGIPFSQPHLQSSTNHSKIDKTHSHYNLALGMMIGIRESVGGFDGLLEAELDEQDFTTSQLFQECRRNRKYWFENYQFKAYAPLVFARIRSHFGIDKQLFLHSICGNFSYLEFLSNAKSGSFFFFSHDGRYLIKTLTLDECHFLQSMLPKYYHYLTNNPHSFLTHFYGLYRLTTQTGQQIYFSIMKSILDTPLKIQHTYDLKGSTLGRKAKPNETVMKDLDILKQERKLRLGASTKHHVLDQLRRDATFLARLGIMDYSFLLGVHECDSSPVKSRDIADEKKNEDDVDVIQLEKNLLNQQDQYIDWEHLSWKPNILEDSSVDSSIVSSSCLCSPAVSLWAGSSEGRFDGPNPFTSREDRGIEGRPNVIYYCGIIDILQPYNARKWGETVVRKVQGNSEQEISCVDPETYANRFIKFLSGLME